MERNAPPRVTSDFVPGATLAVGDVVEFTVRVMDPDGDPVSLTLLNPPAGMAFAPVRNGPATTRQARWIVCDTARPDRLVFEARDEGTPQGIARLVLPYRVFASRGSGWRVTDLDGDGGLDLLANAHLADLGGVANQGAFYFWSDPAAASGAPSATMRTFGPYGLGDTLGWTFQNYRHRLVDVTGDGFLDLVAEGSAGAGLPTSGGGVYVFEAGPSLAGTVGPRADLRLPSPSSDDAFGIELEGFEDFDGDGTVDVLASVPRYDYGGVSLSGALFYWRGGASLSGAAFPDATLYAPGAAVVNRVGDRFGVADVTGDGRLDVVASSQLFDVDGFVDSGAIFVWPGGAGWSGDTPPAATLFVAEPGALLRSFVLRDLDGDGDADVLAQPAVPAGGFPGPPLAVWLGGPSLQGEREPDVLLGCSSAPQGFDGSPRFVDVTGDGSADAVSWNTRADVNGTQATGAFYVWPLDALAPGSREASVLSDPDAVALDKLGESDRINDGPALEVADVTGDGIADLVVAAPYADVGAAVDAGRVHVFAGRRSWPAAVAPDATLTNPAPVNNDELGNAFGPGGLQLADVDADGIHDVIVGAYLKDVGTSKNQGAIYVWHGGPGLSGAPPPSATLTGSDALPGDQLGNLGTGAYGIQVADLTGDGQPDLVAGAHLADGPGFVADVGAIYVFAGGPTLSGATSETAVLRVPGARAKDRLGLSCGQGIQLVDVTHDGFLDVAATSSYLDVGTLADVGGVHVWAGGPCLVGSRAPTATLTSSSAIAFDAMGEMATSAEALGQGLWAADLTHDGVLDLIAGAVRADVAGVTDAGAFYLWRGPILATAGEDVRLSVPGAQASDLLGY